MILVQIGNTGTGRKLAFCTMIFTDRHVGEMNDISVLVLA